MAKYYVESGNLQLVVHAKNGHGAALWAVHRSLAQLMPFISDDDDTNGAETPASDGVSLGAEITCNERGFGRGDGERFDTFELVTQWNQLMVALDKLELFAEAS
jgi:hypothetical protein